MEKPTEKRHEESLEAPVKEAVVGAGPETPPTETSVERGVKALPEKEKLGVLRGIANIGFKAQEWKGKFFSEIYGKLARGYEGREENQKFLGRFWNARAERAEKIYEQSLKDQKDLREGTGAWKKTKGTATLYANAALYGRTIWDGYKHLTGGDAFINPLRYVTAGAMFIGATAEDIKEAQFKSEAKIQEGRVHDIDQAYAEAFELMELAKQANPHKEITKENLDSAFNESLPKDILRRFANGDIQPEALTQEVETEASVEIKKLEEDIQRLRGNRLFSAEDREKQEYETRKKIKSIQNWTNIIRTGEKWKDAIGNMAQRGAELDITMVVRHIETTLASIDANEALTPTERKQQKEKVLASPFYKKFLEDVDRMVTNAGAIDLVAYGSRLIEGAGKKVAVMMAIETLFEGIGRTATFLVESKMSSEAAVAVLAEHEPSAKKSVHQNTGSSTLTPEMNEIGTRHTIVEKGQGLWEASRRMVGHGLTEQQWQEAWKNTFVEVDGKKVHISEMGLVHPSTTIFYDTESGTPRFEIMPEGKMGTNEDLYEAVQKSGTIEKPQYEWLREAVGKKSADVDIDHTGEADVTLHEPEADVTLHPDATTGKEGDVTIQPDQLGKETTPEQKEGDTTRTVLEKPKEGLLYPETFYSKEGTAQFWKAFDASETLQTKEDLYHEQTGIVKATLADPQGYSEKAINGLKDFFNELEERMEGAEQSFRSNIADTYNITLRHYNDMADINLKNFLDRADLLKKTADPDLFPKDTFSGSLLEDTKGFKKLAKFILEHHPSKDDLKTLSLHDYLKTIPVPKA